MMMTVVGVHLVLILIRIPPRPKYRSNLVELAGASYSRNMGWYFAFFIVSGFCSLIYEVVWLRLAMAAFGVTTPLVSIVLSVFMAGLALGSFGGGRLARRLETGNAAVPLRLYAVAELLIGFSGLAVPGQLAWGAALLATSGQGVDWNSAGYYLASGAWVTLTLLPYAICMGATFPLAMAAMRRSPDAGARRSFSYLYLANVLGAAAGTLAAGFVLIELLGFRRTLYVAATFNLLLAVCAFAVSSSRRLPAATTHVLETTATPVEGARQPMLLVWLFLTGLVSMAMELVWVRQFTPFLGSVVYTFAAILAIYLVSTFVGSQRYRAVAAAGPSQLGRWALFAWLGAGVFGLLPLAAADPLVEVPGWIRLVTGIVPFCAAVGFLTPMLIDRWSLGSPARAGSAYAVNVVGSILGPLVAGFWLLPGFGERVSLVVLAVPLLAAGIITAVRPSLVSLDTRSILPRPIFAAAFPVIAGALLVFSTSGFDTFHQGELRRDHTATVIATWRGQEKHLLVNGEGVTTLLPITKMMAHLPAAMLDSPPRDALVVCLGMGTTFRSFLSWDVRTTAVELVPSVPDLLGFFHADAPTFVRSPLARIVVDDGRRFLERSNQQYDVITIDPPPPVEAAGSSLLYSTEFYALARKRLRPNGLVAQWLPEFRDAEVVVRASIAQAMAESFPHVRVFRSVEGWGYHFIASQRPITVPPADVLAARMPPRAVADMLEWGPATTASAQLNRMVSREVSLQSLVAAAPGVPVLRDDRPYNEYYLLRRLLSALPR
jgi:spermidine synthase